MQPGHVPFDRGKVMPNAHLQQLIVSACDDDTDMDECTPRTDLDSHANMPVVGCHCVVVQDAGRSVDVNPFTPDYKSMTVRVVDAVVRYDCPYTGASVLLMLWNALHVPSMSNNLVPPFAIREAGVQLNDTPKIHAGPSVDAHCIVLGCDQLRIPLQLHGVFSYFSTWKPTIEECETLDVFAITPEK